MDLTRQASPLSLSTVTDDVASDGGVEAVLASDLPHPTPFKRLVPAPPWHSLHLI